MITDEDGITWDTNSPEYTGHSLLTEAQAIEASLERENQRFRKASNNNRRNPFEPDEG
jgi:hypothetical protein